MSGTSFSIPTLNASRSCHSPSHTSKTYALLLLPFFLPYMWKCHSKSEHPASSFLFRSSSSLPFPKALAWTFSMMQGPLIILCRNCCPVFGSRAASPHSNHYGSSLSPRCLSVRLPRLLPDPASNLRRHPSLSLYSRPSTLFRLCFAFLCNPLHQIHFNRQGSRLGSLDSKQLFNFIGKPSLVCSSPHRLSFSLTVLQHF